MKPEQVRKELYILARLFSFSTNKEIVKMHCMYFIDTMKLPNDHWLYTVLATSPEADLVTVAAEACAMAIMDPEA